jgi:DNA-binding PadR family transcriptional regulator
MAGTEKASGAGLSENEGSLLAFVLRRQPVTAYQVVKAYEASPATRFNASKGTVYPAIKRLRQRGFLESDSVPGDGRNSETLRCTRAGRAAVRKWTLEMNESLVVLDDPLRTRFLSLDELSPSEKIRWVSEAKALVAAKMARVEQYNRDESVPYQRYAFESAMDMLRAKMKWLDELLYEIVGKADV